MKIIIWALSIVVVLILAYYIWAKTGRDYSAFGKAESLIEDVVSQGEDAGKGNVLGFQPYMRTIDYSDANHFTDALRPYFKKARSMGFLRPNSVVVLPEYIGSWLAVSNEKTDVYRMDSLNQAISIIANSNIFSFIKYILISNSEDKIKRPLFLMKARTMARIYENVFSSLSKQYNVTIVAGSIVLPNPSVDAKGRLHIGKGPLFNASFIFGTDGKIIAFPIKKMFLANEEKSFTSAAANKTIHPVRTPAGNLLVLLSFDSWYATYSKLKGKADFLVVPSMAPDSIWNSPWKSSDGFKTAAQINKDDSGKLSNNEAWIKYSLRGKAARAGISNGLVLFSAGRLWETSLPGRAITLQHDSIHVYENSKGKIVNLWLN